MSSLFSNPYYHCLEVKLRFLFFLFICGQSFKCLFAIKLKCYSMSHLLYRSYCSGHFWLNLSWIKTYPEYEQSLNTKTQQIAYSLILSTKQSNKNVKSKWKLPPNIKTKKKQTFISSWNGFLFCSNRTEQRTVKKKYKKKFNKDIKKGSKWERWKAWNKRRKKK